MCAEDVFPAVPYDQVGAHFAGNRPLGIVAQRHARYAENRRFLLQSPAVGDHEP